MKSPMCKICGHPHRLGDPHVLPKSAPEITADETGIVRYGETPSPIADAMERESKAAQRKWQRLSATQKTFALLMARPLQDFVDQPNLIESLPPDVTVLFARVHHRLKMRTRRSQT